MRQLVNCKMPGVLVCKHFSHQCQDVRLTEMQRMTSPKDFFKRDSYFILLMAYVNQGLC